MSSSNRQATSTRCPHILVRSKGRVELFPAVCPSNNDKDDGSIQKTNADLISKGGVTLLSGASCSFHAFSPDGSKLLLLRPSVGVVLLRNMERLTTSSTSSSNAVTDLETSISQPFLSSSQSVHLAYFSPLSNYIVTWERPTKVTGDVSPPDNLKIWSAEDGTLLRGWFAKAIPKRLPGPDSDCAQYSILQFTHDEKLVAHLVSNEVHLYDSSCWEGEKKKSIMKVRCPNIASFSLPPQNHTDSDDSRYLMGSFVPEIKGKPARVSLHQISISSLTETTLVSKSFYQTESVNIKWSPQGNAALVQTQNTVDTSGQTYYGSSTLYLLLTTECVSVTLPGKGNNIIHDVAWCPSPHRPPCFALLSGSMPAMGSLHHGGTADPIFTFGEAHRNVVSWAPHGRFLCLAGFGNLAGGMDFWDRNKLKKMPRFAIPTAVENDDSGTPIVATAIDVHSDIRAHCAVGYGWSPDSRSFFVSTTSPRMNVDNGIKIFKYNGYGPFDQHNKTVSWDNQTYLPDKLLAVQFVPSLIDAYPDRAQSPPPKSSSTAVAAATTTTKITPTTAPPSTTGRYIPPSQRARISNGGGNSLADRMRREREGSTAQAGRVVRPTFASNTHTQKVIPGLAPPCTNTTQKSKNAAKREKQRLAKQQKKQKEEEERLQLEEEARQKEEEEKKKSAVVVDPEKRAKKIRKMLKQIEELKQRDQTGLNDDQINKLTMEDVLRRELEGLAL